MISNLKTTKYKKITTFFSEKKQQKPLNMIKQIKICFFATLKVQLNEKYLEKLFLWKKCQKENIT